MTTTTRGKDARSGCGGVAGSCTVGSVATMGRGWAICGTEAIVVVVAIDAVGAGLVGGRAAFSFSLFTSSLAGRMSRIILPTPIELCDLRRSMGALAVLRRRPALITVFAEFCACHECAVDISGVGARDGWGKGTVGDKSIKAFV